MATGNVFTYDGRNVLLNRFFKSSPDYGPASGVKFGTGTTTPTVDDTDIEEPIPINNLVQVDDCDATTGWTAGTDSAVTLNNTTYVQGTGSLNLTKSGTSGLNCSISKTTTSANMGTDSLRLFFYILNSTALNKLATNSCVIVRFGSDSSNYYEWFFDRADLSTGWNVLKDMTTSNGIPTGLPVTTAMDYTLVQFTTNNASDTTSAGDIIVDNILLGSSADAYDAFQSGIPIFDEGTQSVTIVHTLGLTTANGYNITEFGTFNSDSTNLCLTHWVITSVTKNGQVILTVSEKWQS